MQAKLLRAIQEKQIQRIGAPHPLPVDVRLITATNSDLRAEIKKSRFREDLYYRLNVIPVHLPPLRERKEDVPLLANHFLHKFNHEFGKKLKGIKKDTMQLLMEYSWPGNIRELENLIERLIVLSKSESLDSSLLPSEIKGEVSTKLSPSDVSLHQAVKKFEADFIRRALDKSGGKKSVTAKLLGIHRNTLRQLEKELKLE